MTAKLTRLTHKIAIKLHVVTESCTICITCSRRPVRELLDTPSYIQITCSASCCHTIFLRSISSSSLVLSIFFSTFSFSIYPCYMQFDIQSRSVTFILCCPHRPVTKVGADPHQYAGLTYLGSRDSSVSIVTRLRAVFDSRQRMGIFLLPHRIQTCSGAHLTSYLGGIGDLSSGVKRPEA
jgi:hypothetical protein